MGIQDIYIEYGQLLLVSVYIKNWNLDPRNKLRAIPHHFPAGSFAALHSTAIVKSRANCVTVESLNPTLYAIAKVNPGQG